MPRPSVMGPAQSFRETTAEVLGRNRSGAMTPGANAQACGCGALHVTGRPASVTATPGERSPARPVAAALHGALVALAYRGAGEPPAAVVRGAGNQAGAAASSRHCSTRYAACAVVPFTS